MRDSRFLQVSVEGPSRSAAFSIKQKVLMTYSSPESATLHGGLEMYPLSCPENLIVFLALPKYKQNSIQINGLMINQQYWIYLAIYEIYI